MPAVRVASGCANLRFAKATNGEADCRNAGCLVRPVKCRENAMSAMSDLIEDWIQIRSTLQRQLEMLDSNETQGNLDISDGMRETTINHIKQWVAGITSLLKEYTAHP